MFDFIPGNYLDSDSDDYEDNKESKSALLWPVFNARIYHIKVASEYMPFSTDF